MTLPHVLLVDDSEAVLAFERAVLGEHHDLTTATNGQEALLRAARVHPDLILLDLSMPQMDGGEVLARLKQDPALCHIPVVVMSTEKDRAPECLTAGAEMFLTKPVTADVLLEAVRGVLSRDQARRTQGSLEILTVEVGPHVLCVPLSSVQGVLSQLLPCPLPGAPRFIPGFLDMQGNPVCLLDVATRLGVTHSVDVVERKLVVVVKNGLTLALCVDRVHDPEVVMPQDVILPERLGGTEHSLLRQTLVAMVRTARGLLPVVDPHAWLSRALLRQLPALLRQAHSLPGNAIPEGA